MKRSPALDFVERRRKAYELANATQTWAMRGLGFLFLKHHIVLEAFLPEPIDTGQAEVIIRNVYDPSVMQADAEIKQMDILNATRKEVVWRVEAEYHVGCERQRLNRGDVVHTSVTASCASP